MANASAGESAIHPIVRLFERYGVILSLRGLRELEARLMNGAGVILRKEKDGGDVRMIDLGERVVIVAFSGRAVKTFLPPTRLSRKRR